MLSEFYLRLYFSKDYYIMEVLSLENFKIIIFYNDRDYFLYDILPDKSVPSLSIILLTSFSVASLLFLHKVWSKSLLKRYPLLNLSNARNVAYGSKSNFSHNTCLTISAFKSYMKVIKNNHSFMFCKSLNKSTEFKFNS